MSEQPEAGTTVAVLREYTLTGWGEMEGESRRRLWEPLGTGAAWVVRSPGGGWTAIAWSVGAGALGGRLPGPAANEHNTREEAMAWADAELAAYIERTNAQAARWPL